jgi:signal transduction histidine kinase
MVRQQGQRLVDHAARLLRLNRKNISKSFKAILFWIVFVPSMLFLCGAVIFFSQSRSILHRLSILKQGTKNLAAGEFKKVELPNHGRPDEVTGLINNFNEMVEALEHKQELLIQSKKMASIGTFSSGIAHEINNPLNNISLSADILLEDFDDMDKEEIIEILQDIMSQTERASTIVRNLLDFSRARASEMEPLFIDYVIHKTTDLIANELRIHKIALHKQIEDMLPRVNGDLRKLQQVFLNLIINAEQAIGEYGRIEIAARRTDDGYVQVDVSDTGPGIPPEHLDQIFDPFFTTKEAGKGTGLGLAIVYGIVEKHGGYIEVSSKVGEGTTFSVFLPACPYETKEPGVGSEA